jgi:hypothetical protein
VLDLVQSVPLGARDVSLEIDGESAEGGVTQGPHDGTLPVEVPLDGDEHVVRITWSGGLEVAAPYVELTPGQESRGIRVVDFTRDGDGWLLTVEGERELTYPLVLRGIPVEVRDGPAEVGERIASPDLTFLEVRIPAGAGRRAPAEIRLGPAGS